MSYQLHVSGVVVPHIAAGVNLNLPGIGPILRRGGAFFMRRSFTGNPLYSVVFKEYMAQLIDRADGYGLPAKPAGFAPGVPGVNLGPNTTPVRRRDDSQVDAKVLSYA